MRINHLLKNRWKYAILALVLIFVFFAWMSRGPVHPQEEMSYGITFSHKHAEDLDLDWKETYRAILDGLGVRKFRLVAYWDEVEEAPGIYRYDELDWQMEQAASSGASVILAVGGRLPRWPECHYPDWADRMKKEERQRRILSYIERTVKRYKDNPNITAWQVENEPFLSHFGKCPKLDKGFLDKEIALVRELDDRPIVVTDSGELSLWVPAARRADIFGTTLYKNTYSQVLDRYVRYPIKPGFFHFKRNLADLFAEPQEWIVIELQAEPWGPVPYQEMSREERSRTMDLDKFKDIIEFSRQAGFKEFYLWGAEWWYWEKEVNGYDALWREAAKLF